MSGAIHVSLVNGSREPFTPAIDVLVTAFNVAGRYVARRRMKSDAITIDSINVEGNVNDNYTVLVSAKGHKDAGRSALRVIDGPPVRVELMLLPRDPVVNFVPLDMLKGRHAEMHALLERSCIFGETVAQLYSRLTTGSTQTPSPLACVMNIVTALRGLSLPAAPKDSTSSGPAAILSLIKRLRLEDAAGLQPDRFFAWAHPDLIARLSAMAALRDDMSPFTGAPFADHPDATASFKQRVFPEANVQLTFADRKHPAEDPALVLLDADIDYFKGASHFLLEYVPHKVLKPFLGRNSVTVTDPRVVYGLRWAASRPNDFAPPFTIVAKT